jgi:hypothetical protein
LPPSSKRERAPITSMSIGNHISLPRHRERRLYAIPPVDGRCSAFSSSAQTESPDRTRNGTLTSNLLHSSDCTPENECLESKTGHMSNGLRSPEANDLAIFSRSIVRRNSDEIVGIFVDGKRIKLTTAQVGFCVCALWRSMGIYGNLSCFCFSMLPSRPRWARAW